MSRAYREALVHIHTDDGINLEGVLITPDEQDTDTVVVWVHGSSMHFAARQYVEIGRALAEAGVAFLSVNTRSHDTATFFLQDGEVLPAGAIWARYDETPRDIEAWMRYATNMGYRRIILAGHSLAGPETVLFAAAHGYRLAGLVLASSLVEFPSYPERLALAQQMVEEGRGQELLPHMEGTPTWNIISAGTVVTRDALRRAFEDVDGGPVIERVRVPIFAFFGDGEPDAAENLGTITAATTAAPSCITATIDAADHNYTDRGAEVADNIMTWVRSSVWGERAEKDND